MTTASSATRVKDDYAQQIAGDLAANRAAQEQRRTELEQLQRELRELGEGEKVLLRMQDALGTATGPATARPDKHRTQPATVPPARTPAIDTKQTRQPAPPPAAADAPPPRKTTGTVPAPAAAKAPRPRKTTGTGGAKAAAGGPSWLTLVTAVLAGGTEPRSAAEVTEALGAAHPTRTVQAAVIRNTLEQGVARGLLERSKQGRSVYYSPTHPTPGAHTTEQPKPKAQP
ncbi:hypothetical protein ACWGIU_38110 [Streptomyces sp. NPDC054840]